jgi:hypothetical protein
MFVVRGKESMGRIHITRGRSCINRDAGKGRIYLCTYVTRGNISNLSIFNNFV